MKDSPPDSISEIFKKTLGNERQKLDSLRKSLSSMADVVGQINQSGIDIRLEVVTLDTAKEYNFRGVTDAIRSNLLYCVLHIYDAQFILRLKPQNLCDLRERNINEPRHASGVPPVYNLSESGFWSTALKYDLSRAEDRNKLIRTLVSFAAYRSAYHELTEYNTDPAGNGKPSKNGIHKSL